MEIDREDPCYIFSDGSALKIYNYQTKKHHTFVGNVHSHSFSEGDNNETEFDTITGFSLITDTQLLLIDSNNHCLRHFDRRNGTTIRYAGQCQVPGHEDGDMLSAKFYHPQQMVYSNDKKLAHITDKDNKAIRQIVVGATNETEVETWLQLTHPPNGIATDRTELFFFVTTATEVLQIDRRTKEIFPLIESKSPGFQDGYFESARFDHPYNIEHLESMLLVTEPKSNRVRVLSLPTGTVSSLCNGKVGPTSASTVENCQIEKPLSIIVHDRQRIRKFVIGSNGTNVMTLNYDTCKEHFRQYDMSF